MRSAALFLHMSEAVVQQSGRRLAAQRQWTQQGKQQLQALAHCLKKGCVFACSAGTIGCPDMFLSVQNSHSEAQMAARRSEIAPQGKA